MNGPSFFRQPFISHARFFTCHWLVFHIQIISRAFKSNTKTRISKKKAFQTCLPDMPVPWWISFATFQTNFWCVIFSTTYQWQFQSINQSVYNTIAYALLSISMKFDLFITWDLSVYSAFIDTHIQPWYKAISKVWALSIAWYINSLNFGRLGCRWQATNEYRVIHSRHRIVVHINIATN